jgi:phytoene/squalene synthetase
MPEKNNQRAEFYQNHLDRVSRSFAFCIARLPSPLREQVGLSYLICRILDTVEDADWPNKSLQAEQFIKFDELLVSKFTDEDFGQWRAKFPTDLPEGERLLLDDASIILRDFQNLPELARNAIEEPVLSMSRGMHHFALSKNHNQLRLKNLREVNQYCFFVAGVVGEILTRLVANTIGKAQIDRRELVDAFHFGLFLQKINILKDQRSDEEHGRFLVPSRNEVVASLREHAARAIEYVTSIPKSHIGFRLFCSWSLFLGLASLPWIQQGWEQKDLSKIPRDQTQALLKEVESIVGDDVRLKNMFEFLVSVSGADQDQKTLSPDRERVVANVFPRIYRGLLTEKELSQFDLA